MSGQDDLIDRMKRTDPALNVECPDCHATPGTLCVWSWELAHLSPNSHWARRSRAEAPSDTQAVDAPETEGGVLLTPGQDLIEVIEALKPVLRRLEHENNWRAPAVRSLIGRLESALS